MNIVNKLTLRHLRLNKRRTLVTIMGVIISVAMITAVATLGVSFLDVMKRQMIASEGEWHVLYEHVNKEQIAAIREDEATKKMVLSRDAGYAHLAGSQNDLKPYLLIKEYNEEGFEQFPIQLSRGRMPQAANEVVVSEAVASNAKVEFQIGDELTLYVGKRFRKDEPEHGMMLGKHYSLVRADGVVMEELRHQTERSFIVVGFIERPAWEPTWSPGYTVITYLDENDLEQHETVNAMVVLKKVNSSLFTHAEKLAADHHIQKIDYNSSLLRYYGVTKNDGLRRTLYSLLAIIMTVIVVGSVTLIYNAFAISVSERSRYLGMLSSVGATKRQKRNSVFFEGAVIGLISIPVGIVCGLVGIGFTFMFINTLIEGALGMTEKLQVTVTPYSILVACAVSLATIMLSAYVPARRASRISAIDAIRQTADVKLTRKAVKTTPLLRRLFGLEADLGLKNLKRNKRRYQATVFSLVISIVLFLAVSYFTSNLQKSIQLSQVGVNYDIRITLHGDNETMDRQLLQSIASLPDVTAYSVMNEMYVESWIKKAAVPQEVQQSGLASDNDGEQYLYTVSIHALDEQSVRNYAEKIGLDAEKLLDSKRMPAVVIDKTSYQDFTGKYVEVPTIHAKAGDKLILQHNERSTRMEAKDGEADEIETLLGEVEIIALTDEHPMGVYKSSPGGLNVIISTDTLGQLLNGHAAHRLSTRLYLNSESPLTTQQQVEEMNAPNMYVHNLYQERQNEEQMVLMMSVFTYGFILLISAISLANIFNTISTSIALRKREFAMLKSVGMTPKSFNNMIHYESIFYGIKSLTYGLPISIGVMYMIYRSMMHSFSYTFTLPWKEITFVVIAVFMIVGTAMLYSSSKVKKENIIDSLKNELA